MNRNHTDAFVRFHISTVAACMALGSFLLASPAAHAARIVSSSVSTPSLFGANTIDATDSMAESFVVLAATTVSGIAVQTLDADPLLDAGQSFVLAVYGDSGGLPGLDFNAPDQGQVFATSVTYLADGWNGVTGLQWELTPGTYWLAVEAGSDAGEVASLALPGGALPAAAGVAYYSGGRTYAATGSGDAFGLRIDAVSAVPEPSSFAILLLGLGAVALGRRRFGAPADKG